MLVLDAICKLSPLSSDVMWQVIESHIHHIVHAADNIPSLWSLEAETLCQVIESASRDSKHKSETSSHPQHTTGSQTSQDGDRETSARNRCCKSDSTSGQSERREVTPMIPADSGYIGSEDKLSPPVEARQTRDVPFSLMNTKLRPRVFGDSNMKRFNIDSDLKINTDNIVVPNPNKRQASMYDNMSPEKGFLPMKLSAQAKYGFDKYQQLKLNNLNVQSGSDASAVTVSTTTRILSDPSLILRDIQPPLKLVSPGFESRDPILPAALPIHQSCGFNTMVFPTGAMKNLKWIKLDESVVGETLYLHIKFLFLLSYRSYMYIYSLIALYLNFLFLTCPPIILSLQLNKYV